jgi:hypothetical protein
MTFNRGTVWNGMRLRRVRVVPTSPKVEFCPFCGHFLPRNQIDSLSLFAGPEFVTALPVCAQCLSKHEVTVPR